MLYIFIILLFLYILSNIQENFENISCPKPYKIPRKCMYKFNGVWITCPPNSRYPEEKCYACPWKRPGLDFKDNSYCCHRKCYERKEFPTGKPYYCENEIADDCVKKYSNNDRYRYCGMHMLYNTPAKVYDSLEECKYSLNKFKNLHKEKCLKTIGAGWCTDYLGEGLCVPGTPLGPHNLIKYYTCFPNQHTNKNSWTYN